MSTQVRVIPTFMPMQTKRDMTKYLDAERHGRWVNNDTDRIKFLEDLGYRVERTSGHKPSGDKGALDGAIMAGGDVLMSCPKEEFEARQTFRNQLAEQQLRGPMETFKTEASKHDVEVEDNTKLRKGLLSDVMTTDGNPKSGED
jgi:hypothetical protein